VQAATRSTDDDGRVWIPVIHVSGGSPTSRTEASKSEDTYRSVHVVEALPSRRDDVGVSPPAVDGRRAAGDGRGAVVAGGSQSYDGRGPVVASGSQSYDGRGAVVAGGSQSYDGRGPVVASGSQSFVVDVADRRSQARSGSAELRDSTARKTDTASSLRAGSGVGSYGFRSSIVVDPASTRRAASSETPATTSRSTATVTLQQSAGDGGWVVEKAL